MNLNCKPGDLAITFGAPCDNGLIVEVEVAEMGPLQADINPAWGPFWRVTSKGSPFHLAPYARSHTAIWPDRLLRPIGNPGEDAKDEMLRPLPADAHQVETAAQADACRRHAGVPQ